MAVPIRLFDEKPPREDSNLINSLFVDRVNELQEAIELLLSAVNDLADGPHLPMGISGNARLGKSHLLWRLVGDPMVREQFDVVTTVRLLPGAQDIRQAMAKIAKTIVTDLHNYSLVKGLASGGPGGSVATQPVIDILDRFENLITGDATSMTLKVGDTWTSKVSSKLGLSTPSFLKVVASGSGEYQTEESRERALEQSIDLGPVSIEHLAELARIAHELVNEKKKTRVLVVVDDFDLMHRDDNGNYDPLPLLRGLQSLCESARLHVITTVRRDTYKEQIQSFEHLTEVREFDDDRFLMEIYDRLVNAFNDGNAILRGAVEKIAADSAGRVGIFLRTLREVRIAARRAGLNDGSDPKEDLALYERYRDLEWTRVVREDPRGADVLLRAVRDNRGSLQPGDMTKLRGFESWGFVLEDFTSSDSGSVNPVWSELIRKQLAQP